MLTLVFISAAVILLLAGVMLLALGLRGRRIDDHPICRKCRFDLVGIYPAQDRCPECGTRLAGARAVRQGARRKRKGLVIAAIPLLLLGFGSGGVLGWSSATSYNWYAVSPDWLLEAMAGFDDQAKQVGAVEELATRLGTGRLSGDRADRLIARGLAIQADEEQPWVVEWGDLIEAGIVADRLSREQFEAYVQQGIECRLEIRKKVRQGEDAMVRIQMEPMRFGSGISLLLTLHWPETRTEEGVVLLPAKGKSAHYGFTGGRSGYGITAMPAMIELAPGQYTLTAAPALDVEVSGYASSVTLDPVRVQQELLRVPFEVVPLGTPLVEFVDDPSLQEQMEAGIGSIELRVSAEGDDFTHLSFEVRGSALPMDYAFDAMVVDPAGEPQFLLRSVIRAGGQRGWGSMGKLAFPLEERATVIFRASEQAALEQADLGPVWGGEIVIEDVPVVRLKPAEE